MVRTGTMKSCLQALVLLALMAIPAAIQAQQVSMDVARSDRVGPGLARALLTDARASAVYISPTAVPRFSYSYSVTLNSHTSAVKLDRIATGGKDLEAATAAAMEKLDAQLRQNGSDRNKIVQMDVFYVGKDFDGLMRVSNVLDQYFAGRMAYANSLNTVRPDAKYVDYPVRPILGVKDLEGDALVAVEARILNPKAYTYNEVVNPNVDLSPSGPMQVLVGGVTAMQPNYLVAGYGNNEVQADAAIANLQRILDGVGMDRGDVTKVTAYYTASADPEMIRAKLKAHFGAKLEIDAVLVEAACVEAATVLLNAEGVMQ